MRFLEVIRTLRRSSGGPAESLRINAAGYLELGRAVEVLTLDPAGRQAIDLGVPVHELGARSEGYGYSTAARV